MSCEQIRAYAEGWARFQNRLHGGKTEESDKVDDLPDVSQEDQEMLARFMMRKPNNA